MRVSPPNPPVSAQDIAARSSDRTSSRLASNGAGRPRVHWILWRIIFYLCVAWVNSGWCESKAPEPALRLLSLEPLGLVTPSATTNPGSPPRVEIVRPPYRAFNGPYAPPETEARIRVAVEDADGDVAEVRFYESTHLIGLLTNAPFTMVWFPEQRGPGTNCDFMLRAVALDRSGLSATSAPMRFCVGITEPANILNEITSPAGGRMFAHGAGIELTSEALITIVGDHTVSMDFCSGIKIAFHSAAGEVRWAVR